jgi:ribonucleoside-triphosphate reductase (thioredoxin)
MSEQLTDYRRYIAMSRYARWLPNENRRETWEETVKRVMDFWYGRFPDLLGESADEDGDFSWYDILHDAILRQDIMPSMRTMMTAGPALDRDEVAGYNCSYVAVDSARVFDEIMYVLLCGTGVGYSVEKKYVSKLPEISEEFHDTDTTIVFADSKIGWASGFRELISLLYAGKVPRLDFGRVRPAGAPLRTFGGRASGPAPLMDLCNFSIEVFKNARGRKLTTLEAHDLVCKVAEIVVVGGVRRSALISLSDLDDGKMRQAKMGAWWENNVQRALANNSAVYEEKPDIGRFMEEWKSLYDSKSGERGIFNRQSANLFVPERRADLGYTDWGTNPCSEIVLRSKQFCNLSEVVVRSTDTPEVLRRKVRLATILGTLQSTLTNFRYLSAAWKRNTEEERLLGVSLTGIMDNRLMSGAEEGLEDLLEGLKHEAIQTNFEWADRLGIGRSSSITCVKPSGTVSQLVDSASGIHPRYSEYYVRTVRADKKDPMSEFLISQGVPHEADVTKPNDTWVFSFPQKAPHLAVMRDDVSAIDQLELWLTYQKHWCEHKPSITVYVREHEWLDVGAWVYRHFDFMSGVSFLPHSEHTYKQAPYQEISEAEYEDLESLMPVIKWEEFKEYRDTTTSSQEYACVSGQCEI